MIKTYTITFDEKKKRYRLTPETGRAILVRADHKKFEWLQNQEKGKIVKINESGRWTVSKDYEGLYDAVKSLSKKKLVENTPATKVIKVKSATKEKTNNSVEAESPAKPKVKIKPKAEIARSILGYHEVNLIGAKRLSKYVEDEEFKREKKKILEKTTCSNCKGTGKIISISFESTGFLNLKKKQVRTESVCSNCDGIGYLEKTNWPYRLEEPKLYECSTAINFNFDLVAKEILNIFITKDEFTKDELLSFLASKEEFKKEAYLRFREKYPDEDLWIYTNYGTPAPEGLVWESIRMYQVVHNMLSGKEGFSLIGAEPFIPPLFKTQVIDNGTKRRSSKDDNIYYKFTKKAKNLYKDL